MTTKKATTPPRPLELLFELCCVVAVALAAGVPSAARDSDFAIATAGYVTMRLGLVARRTAIRCAARGGLTGDHHVSM